MQQGSRGSTATYSHHQLYTIPNTWHPHIYDKPPMELTPFFISDILGLSKKKTHLEQPEDWTTGSSDRHRIHADHGKSPVSMHHHVLTVNGDTSSRTPASSPEGPAGPTPPPETDLLPTHGGRPHSPLINVDDSDLVIGKLWVLVFLCNHHDWH